jgi:predicted AAA+ superfamily ATPase
MRAYFEAIALNTAGLASEKSLYDAAGINAKTASRYERLFTELFVTEQGNAWSTNRLARLGKHAKRYFIDPALAAATIDADRATVLTNPDFLGRLLDTFVLAQLRPEFATAERAPRLHHLRAANGRQEVDIIVETTGGRIFAFEVKASAAVTTTDAKHLRWLRDEIGEKFVRGVVLHTGPDIFELSERILAVPICAIWL